MSWEQRTSKDDFEFWVFNMEDALESFWLNLPTDLREKLDFSIESLNSLEAWILEQYPNLEMVQKSSESKQLNGIARYVGETFRKSIGGHWDICLDDSKKAFFGVPILIEFEKNSTPFCPLALTIASVHRRTGKFLSTILQKKVDRLRRSSMNIK